MWADQFFNTSSLITSQSDKKYGCKVNDLYLNKYNSDVTFMNCNLNRNKQNIMFLSD